MEQLKYTVADKTIAYLLGVNNYISDESALLEIIKNSYDAGALNLRIIFGDDSITLIDDGKGMNYEDIKNHWMNVGVSEKIDYYEIMDVNSKPRVLSGSKGVGRFALARIGEMVKIISKKDNCKTVIWTTDWENSNIEEVNEKLKHGTKIIVTNLREKWTNKRVNEFEDFLSQVVLSDSMKIVIEFENQELNIVNKLMLPRVGVNCLESISIRYTANDGRILVKITSDEFLEEAKLCCGDINIFGKEVYIDAYSEFKKNNMNEDELIELKETLTGLGDFNAELYFNLSTKSLEDDMNKFLYKHDYLVDSLDGGIGLYRNDFIITPYYGKKDWLDLGKRSRKSPAAASHPTGTWRVRSNQLSGKVLIDRKENEHLVELANRQGLDENRYYQCFIDIILTGISEFERYRQSIIRSITKDEVDKVENDTPLIHSILKNKVSILELSDKEYVQLLSEIKLIQKKNELINNEKIDTERNYKYDVQILNVLATIGLKASSIAHKLENKKQAIIANTNQVILNLKEYGIWDDLKNQEFNSRKKYKNIPLLLEEQDQVNKIIISFIDTMLSKIEKQQFKIKETNINNQIKKIIETWEQDYAWLKIKCISKCDVTALLSADVLQVVFDNLLLNSIQQNDGKTDRLQVAIKVEKHDDGLYIDYKDNGVGLHKKYLNEPERILNVHETTRENGHGLGMWIVNNTIVMTGGEVLSINSNGGFNIKFRIGGVS